MTATKKTIGMIRFLLIAAILVMPVLGYFWIMAGVIDFLRVRRFGRPIFCILTAESAVSDSGFETHTGFLYSFEIKRSFSSEDPRPSVTAYTAKIMNTPVMAAVRNPESFESAPA